MEIDVTIEGADRLIQRLQSMGANTDVFIDRALEKGAKRMQAEIKVNTPVDTGDLRNSISVEKAGHLRYQIGTNKEYAVPVEYGTGKFGDPTVDHTEKESWVYFSDKLGHYVTSHGHPPTHFMHNSFIASKDDTVEVIKKELMKWLT